jgi:hypothetical protein
VNIFETKSAPGTAAMRQTLVLSPAFERVCFPKMLALVAKRCILRQIIGAHTAGLDDF